MLGTMYLKHTECRPRGNGQSRCVSGSVKNCSEGAVESNVPLDVPIVIPEHVDGSSESRV